MSETRVCLLLVLSCLAISLSVAPTAQEPAGDGARRGLVSVHATAASDLRNWDATIDRMVRVRQLVVTDSRPDPEIAGRSHESLVQYHDGIPVYGGSLSRQTAQGVAVSIIGTVYEGITVDSVPSLSAADAVRAAAGTTGARLAGDAPQLVIFPTPAGGYRLAYRATMSDFKTYLVDAATGIVLWTVDEIYTQGQVGTGTGALGDTKKISTTQAAGGFRTHDQLRPAQIRTFDTRGNATTFNRILAPPGVVTDSDFAIDTDNTWADPAVVDAHVHAGWMEDYLFKQVSWTGIDNRGTTISSMFHSGFLNNAAFFSAPFGADGRGMFVFGRTTTGVPLTTIDVVGHEMMHGVTHAAVLQRTGTGLLGATFFEPSVPTTITMGGSTLSCDTASATLPDGRTLPFFCLGGRFALAANHGGALHEGFSDIFGIAAEFFHQPAGTGPLRADYKLGEDLTGFGPNRAADVPASLIALPSTLGPISYPDHWSRAFKFLFLVVSGTRTNPIAITPVPWVLVGSQVAVLPTDDGGAVHLNAPIMSHAFYLAIEGGRNATSGITVTGVGAANRAQIERAFFRGITLLLPNAPSMQLAASTIIQASSDLHGANSAATAAIRQAFQAVGLAL